MPWSLILKLLEKVGAAVVARLESNPQLAEQLAEQLITFVLSRLKVANGVSA